MFPYRNVGKAPGISPGSAAPKNDIVIVKSDDILVFPPSDASGVRMLGSFVLKPGAKMITIYSTRSMTDTPYENEGEEDRVSIRQRVVVSHPGNSRDVKEFVQNYLGQNLIVLHKACGDNYYEVCGTPCAPLQLKPAKQDNNDGRMHTLTFESYANSPFVPKEYTGVIITADPVVFEPTLVVFDVPENGNLVQLTNTTAAIEILSVTADHGAFVTLIGGGGEIPAALSPGLNTDESVQVLLRNNQVWLGLRNAVISFTVFKTPGLTYLVESSRA